MDRSCVWIRALLILATGGFTLSLVATAPTSTAEPRCATNYSYDAASQACQPIFSQPVGDCDPYSSGGFQGCLGGGFGGKGESTFLSESQWMFPGTPTPELLTLGHGICRGLADGLSAEAFEDELVRRGVDRVSAIDVVISAQTWLC